MTLVPEQICAEKHLSASQSVTTKSSVERQRRVKPAQMFKNLMERSINRSAAKQRRFSVFLRQKTIKYKLLMGVLIFKLSTADL